MLRQSVDPAFWREYLSDHPEVLHQLIADLYRAATASKERPSTVDDLWNLVNPTFSNEPFGQAVHHLLGTRSVRWLASQLHMAHVPLLRILKGERNLVNIHDPRRSMLRIEAIARVLKVHPSHFAEWRRLWIMTLIDAAMTQNPHLSIGIYRRLAGHESRSQRPLTGAPR